MPDEPIQDEKASAFSTISVIIITHNEEKNIRGCLASLMNITYPEDKFEILVVDSSTDTTPDIAQAYKGVRLIRSEKGFSRQRNAGIKAAFFDILAFTDADCFVTREWLMAIHKAFQVRKIAAIGGDSFPPPETRYFGMCVACVGHPAGGAIGLDANVKRTENGIEFVPGCNFAFRREVLSEVREFNPFFNDGGEDIDFSRRLKDNGYYLDYISDMTIYHKPRSTLKSYIRWNIGVGVTKYNLTKPSLIKLIFQPSFPLWSGLLLLVLLSLIPYPTTSGLFLTVGWGLFLLLLYLRAKPYPLLIKRRKKIGIDLFSILTVIPFLIYLRQVCMNIGQIHKYLKLKSLSGFYK